ncbi:MAG: S9 family peptidase [Candidatus Kapabacteria bacterium]|nr:S9 family peptidase [Candidatus Kapabacteria bacterium]
MNKNKCSNRGWIILSSLIIALAAINLVSAESKLLTPEILLNLKRISDHQISPDGKWVLFNMGVPSITDNKTSKHNYFVSVNGGEIKEIGKGEKGADFSARWSPDGKKIAFLSTRNGAPQIFTMDFPDGTPIQRTSVEAGVDNISWSPDGQYFSYTAEVKLLQTAADKYPALPKVNVKMYESIPVRHWDDWEDETYSHLFIMPSNGGTVLDLMPNEKWDCPLKPFGGAEEIGWSPDSKEIAYSSRKVEKYAESTNSDVYTYNLASKETKNITPKMPGYDKDPSYSPDGNWIAFTSMERAGFESDKNRLMLYNRKSGEISELTKTLDQWEEQYVWSPDSKFIYMVAGDSAIVPIYKFDIQTGGWKVIYSGMFNCDGGLSISNDGKSLIFERRSMLQPFEIYSLNLTNYEAKQITNVNGSALESILKPEIKQRIVTSNDGAKVHCWVLYPPNFDSKKKYPLITYCQGGPQSTINQFFSYRWNLMLMASQGYIVVAPNRRGMPGFGQKWNDAISLDWGGKPMQDIMSATDDMLKESYIDPKGLSAVGASAGGYAVFWLAGNHNRKYSAFISHCGVFNCESMYGETEELWFTNWEYGGPYWDKKNDDFYAKSSPIHFAQNWTTPIMISTGGKDFRIPYTQSLQAFTVAQVKNIPSKLIFFPEESHWILKPQEQILWHKEFYEFLDKYTKH